VQESQASLGRLQASQQRQVVFNRRILENENEVAHINSELSDFLNGRDMTIPTFAFLDVRDQVEGSQPICGQLWVNGSRKMTAASTTLPSLSNSRENVVLSGVADALTWRHTL
jgi:hypothetical protein